MFCWMLTFLKSMGCINGINLPDLLSYFFPLCSSVGSLRTSTSRFCSTDDCQMLALPTDDRL